MVKKSSRRRWNSAGAASDTAQVVMAGLDPRMTSFSAMHRASLTAPDKESPAFAGDDTVCKLACRQLPCYFAPAFWAYSHAALDSGTVRLADSMALALAAVPSRMRPAIPWVMPASRNRL